MYSPEPWARACDSNCGGGGISALRYTVLPTGFMTFQLDRCIAHIPGRMNRGFKLPEAMTREWKEVVMKEKNTTIAMSAHICSDGSPPAWNNSRIWTCTHQTLGIFSAVTSLYNFTAGIPLTC